MDVFDSIGLFLFIGALITVWMMFTDRTNPATVRYNYHANEIYGD